MTLPPALVVEADGGSRGNPGVAGFGALVRDGRSGKVLAERAGPLGIASNNVAEYTGLIEGLRTVLDLGLAEDAAIEVRMDSKLVVEQMSGRWKIKHADMRRLALDAHRLVDEVQGAGGSVEFTWVPRASNAAADALSNDGMDGTTVRRDHVGDMPSIGAETEEPDDDPWARVDDGSAPLSDLLLSDETVPVLEGQTRLVLVRHGVTDFTQSHQIDGRGGSDPALNSTGTVQARAAAAAVARLVERADPGPVAVVSSSLQRARQTGQVIAEVLGVEREEDRDWDEQGFGDWDGRSIGELVREYGNELLAVRGDRDYAPPGGESRRELDERVGAALSRAVARGGTVVVATHRIPLMSVLGRLLGIAPERGWSIGTAPASLTAVEIWPDGVAQVAFVNDTHHLEDLVGDEPQHAQGRVPG